MEFKDNIHIKNITNILSKIGERVEGNLICDIHPDNWVYQQNVKKIHNLQALCKNKKKIIEIGINACHSLILMLLVNPSAEYLLFDLNFHRYTLPCLDYVKSTFPNANIKVIVGSSVYTIPEFIFSNKEQYHTFDFCHLDGGHTEDVFTSDYHNMKKLMKEDGIVIFDDYDMVEIKNFLNRMLSIDEISLIENVVTNERQLIYKYN
jgi:hypothetical protein